ncbi:16S rRNA (guanine(527)-N(7))-methyltransferase RsmG [Membranihabitans marinus]|uniref:16S rRNA (guanine(527)-N(7))-methyltransferase RsmG n=1 Tax=Membranihabitans marinus TaxID=1227546 RepID=UPI001F00F8BC|nr:16S rRNA (guanine(527)-N(7))-methyltransferase RsmG [Membranihabitans marinus]
MKTILKYFTDFTQTQIEQFEKIEAVYRDWNAKINVISRQDIDHIYLHHVLHSLSIAAHVNFRPGSKILDLGTGGGFPGIPLAIFFPEVDFHLIDARRKKITVVNEVIQTLNLSNVYASHLRAEEVKEKYDFVVTRAVAPLEDLVRWSRPLIAKEDRNSIPNGIIALKGGALKKEYKTVAKSVYIEETKISNYFKDPYFQAKYLVYLQY